LDPQIQIEPIGRDHLDAAKGLPVAACSAPANPAESLIPPLPPDEFMARRAELAHQGLGISAIAVDHWNDAEQFVAVAEPMADAKQVTKQRQYVSQRSHFYVRTNFTPFGLEISVKS
jgi:hypothetical protein